MRSQTLPRLTGGAGGGVVRNEVSHPSFAHVRTELIEAEPELKPYWRKPIAKVFFSYRPANDESMEGGIASIYNSAQNKKVMMLLRGTTAVPFRAYPARMRMAAKQKARVLVRFSDMQPFQLEEMTAPQGIKVVKSLSNETTYCWLEVEATEPGDVPREVLIKAVRDGATYSTRFVANVGELP